MTKNFGDEIYMNTQHRYDYSYDELMKFFKKHLKAANGGRMTISEFGVAVKKTHLGKEVIFRTQWLCTTPLFGRTYVDDLRNIPHGPVALADEQ